MPSAVVKENLPNVFSRTYVPSHRTLVFYIDASKILYIMHNYNRYYCTYCIIPCVYCLLSVRCVHLPFLFVLQGFIAPAFPFLEAPVPLCASLRSAGRSAVVLRIAARLVLVQFLPCHRRLLQQISNSHLFRFDYVIY